MVKSGIIPNIEYDQARVLYISNVRQAMLYMRNGAKLLDVLYCNTKNDSLVFVFERNDLAKELYEKWNNHELN